jgi:ABC-type lipoprotein export system ATPase subunit
MQLDISSRECATVIIVTHDPTVASMTSRVFEMRVGLIIKEHVNQSAFAGTKIH